MSYPIDNPLDGRGAAAHFAEQTLKAALAALPPAESFVVGFVPDEASNEQRPGVILRWPDTDEGRAAAALFARLLWVPRLRDGGVR